MSGGSTKNIPRGRALFLEHLPDLHFQKSIKGVLLIIFSNGEAFFYPLNEQTLNISAGAKLISKETTGGKSSGSTFLSSSSVTSADNKYSVFDVPHNLNAEQYRVFSFSFAVEMGLKNFISPKKILLSPNKRLLMVIGVIHRGQNCLVVYEISEPTTTRKEYFKPVFYDITLMFIDACFAPDSKSIVFIPARYPSLLFMLTLPAFSSSPSSPKPTPFEKSRMTSISSDFNASDSSSHTKPISFEARFAGPLHIFGPARGVFGQPLKMSHISGNSMMGEVYHFATWNDEGLGEYCLWMFPKFFQNENPDNSTSFPAVDAQGKELWPNTSHFSYSPRLSYYGCLDRAWLEEPGTPKNYIIDIKFSASSKHHCSHRDEYLAHSNHCKRKSVHRISMVVRRENYDRKADNGIGLQMFETTFGPMDESDSMTTDALMDQGIGSWYQLTDELIDSRDILCTKWTKTLLLGSEISSSILIRGKGMFELVDYRYGSGFQYLYDFFTTNASSFCQIGRYRRFWVTLTGDLRLMMVKPEIASNHPEWRELMSTKSRSDLLNMRMLGRRIGYFIVDTLQDYSPNSSIQSIYQSSSKKMKKPGSSAVATSATGNTQSATMPTSSDFRSHFEGEIESLMGLHLYRCWCCKRPLLKPLQCAVCKSVVYCSKSCQREHWVSHKPSCKETPDQFD